MKNRRQQLFAAGIYTANAVIWWINFVMRWQREETLPTATLALTVIWTFCAVVWWLRLRNEHKQETQG